MRSKTRLLEEYSYDRSASTSVTAEAGLPTARIGNLASDLAHFVMGNRELAIDNLKYLAKVLPEVQMEMGGQYAKEFEALRTAFVVAIKRHTESVEFK